MPSPGVVWVGQTIRRAGTTLSEGQTTSLQSTEQALNEYRPRNELERAAVNERSRAGRAMLTKWQQDLLAGVPDAKIVELPNANLFMFLSNEADVIRELRAFAGSLPRQRGAAK
jgi:hypothetical protein